MNQAQSRRLRTSCLLLLPLLVAGTPLRSVATTSPSSITVTPGPPVRFIVALDPATAAGTAYTLQVLPVDAAGNRTSYSGRVHFETTVLRALLPADTDVNFIPGVTPLPEFPVTFWSAAPDPKTLTITDVTGQNLSGSASTVVRAGPFTHVKLSTTAPDPTPTCSETTLVLTAEDAWDNPVTEVTPVTLCAAPGSSATFVRSSLERSAHSPPCVTGSLAGTAQVVWKDTKQEDVEFTVSGVAAKAPLTLHFKAGLPSPQTSSFSFSESTKEPPALLIRDGQLTAQLTLRDQCGDPATLPAGKILSFAAHPPLAVTPPVEDAPGQWKTSVSMPECPSDGSKTLAVWPLIDNVVLKKSSGEQVKQLVLPQCSAFAKLSVLTPADSLVAEPGDRVEFEVQVSTDSDMTVTGGVLMQEPQGLTVMGASTNGQALPAKADGFELPELRKDSPLTVKVTAQMTTRLHQTVSTKVWVENPEGALLTLMERVNFQQKDLGVDVGCGCHTGGLPGQLATLLALLVVASRPRSGLRRLRRGERNDP